MKTQSPFLNFVAEEMYKRRYAKRTVETYLHWIRFYILFHKKQHPKDLAEPHVEQFLTYLAVKRQVAVQTQALALNTLSFCITPFYNGRCRLISILIKPVSRVSCRWY